MSIGSPSMMAPTPPSQNASTVGQFGNSIGNSGTQTATPSPAVPGQSSHTCPHCGATLS